MIKPWPVLDCTAPHMAMSSWQSHAAWVEVAKESAKVQIAPMGWIKAAFSKRSDL